MEREPSAYFFNPSLPAACDWAGEGRWPAKRSEAWKGDRENNRDLAVVGHASSLADASCCAVFRSPRCVSTAAASVGATVKNASSGGKRRWHLHSWLGGFVG